MGGYTMQPCLHAQHHTHNQTKQIKPSSTISILSIHIFTHLSSLTHPTLLFTSTFALTYTWPWLRGPLSSFDLSCEYAGCDHHVCVGGPMASDYAKTSIEGLDWGIVTDGVVGPSGHIDGWVAVLSPPVTCTCTCT